MQWVFRSHKCHGLFMRWNRKYHSFLAMIAIAICFSRTLVLTQHYNAILLQDSFSNEKHPEDWPLELQLGQHWYFRSVSVFSMFPWPLLSTNIIDVLKNCDPSFPWLLIPYHARVFKRSVTAVLLDCLCMDFVGNIFTSFYHFLVAKFV